MISQVASRFPMTGLTCVGLVLFLIVFIGASIWTFRKGSDEIYRRAGDLPFREGGDLSNE